MHPAFERTAHRPWPLPTRRWTWRQSWCDLLFAHWPIPAERLRPLVPRELEIQSFDGTSWLGIVPFRMEGVMRRPLPDLPWISAFPELNVRLYVERDGRPGVFFLSLDATNPLAVWAARRFFHLPYYRAAISIQKTREGYAYHSRRFGHAWRADRLHRLGDEEEPDQAPPGARFEAIYSPVSAACETTPGTLEHWLTERYCLYARSPGGVLTRTEVHHAPWPLQPAEAAIGTNTMTSPFGLALPSRAPLLHFSRRLDVVVWSPEVA